MPQPVDARTLGVVAVGGAIGVVARAALVVPASVDAIPWITLAVNAVGSLILGIVVGVLDGRRPRLRAFLGTGVLGGFTTYSAFAVQTVDLIATPLAALGLVAGSLAAGVAGAVIGLAIGRRIVGSSGPITGEVAE